MEVSTDRSSSPRINLHEHLKSPPYASPKLCPVLEHEPPSPPLADELDKSILPGLSADDIDAYTKPMLVGDERRSPPIKFTDIPTITLLSSPTNGVHDSPRPIPVSEPDYTVSHFDIDPAITLDTAATTPGTAMGADSPTAAAKRRSVRFRSRVRITSGVHHHKRRAKSQPSTSASRMPNPSALPPLDVDPTQARRGSFSSRGGRDLSAGSGGSLSSSPSSSISAPLRSGNDAESAWGPLGRRVHFLSALRNSGSPRNTNTGGQYGSNGRKDVSSAGVSVNSRTYPHTQPKRKEIPQQWKTYDRDYDWAPQHSFNNGHTRDGERQPLLGSGRGSSNSQNISPSSVRGSAIDDDDDEDYEEDEETRLYKEIDLVFGTWPGRLLNPHWWWWQIEPVVCCSCMDDSDTEED